MRLVLIRLCCAVMLGVSWTGFANAATLSVNSDKLTYNVGETITLLVYGDAEGASAYGIYGRLQYDGSLVDNDTRAQKLMGPGWVKGTLEEGDTNASGPATAYSEAFDQVNVALGDYQTATSPISTVTLIAVSIGVVNVNWDTVTPGSQLNYFGLTAAPGTSFTIVPEPRTAALFALGLLGLAGRRRVRA
jgi:hypothetical protein